MTKGRYKTTNSTVRIGIQCRRSCTICRNAIRGDVVTADKRVRLKPVACSWDHDVNSRDECFDIDINLVPRRCSVCGHMSTDYDSNRSVITCRDCMCEDYTPSYTPQRCSSIAAMEDHAPGRNINWSLINRRLSAAMDRAGIPRTGFRGGLKRG